MEEITAPRGPGRRATITDVARDIGVSKGTVSRALNGHPDISDATRLRAQKAAARLGYRPLGSAQAIRTGRCRALGLVIETGEHDAHRPFLAAFLAGLSDGAALEGWTLTVATAPEGDTLATYQRLIDDRKADGFVLPRTRLRDPRVEMLRGAGVPFVLFGRHGDPEGCAWFDIEMEAAMRASVARLAAAGHRRIAFVGGSALHTYAQLRAEGFRAGMAEAGLRADLMRFGAVDRAGGARAAAALLDAPDPPSAFVYAVDAAALGLWQAARARGLTVGRDLAVIGYDGTPEGAHAEPPLATWAVDTHAAGLRLADLLIRRIRGEAPEALREVGQARYLDRGSAACAGPGGAAPSDDDTPMGGR
ncbi:LacI family DNA-binding transcriptional regulator [Jannaschia seohaensis]|uniref:LacI family transcriptional regulator n=1 Tax=Jannaschia seohaensis TaxID=475081 RepID=A0A2Y9B196_9RHOB|nr:substrate-binding domain-containing protein [Jannaschia seohaensis]PWJ16900.1 LacI family transcriptional regulator [Jannaschia seohaensis]SSA48099.1 LacI family transcriptional regulator [Jannaschia seohaensis]